MSDQPQRAFVSHAPPGVRPALINVDSSGMAMSWKTAWWLGAGLVISVSTVYAAAQSLVFDADLDGHNKSKDAHPVLLERDSEAVPTAEVIKRHDHQLKDLPRLVAQQSAQAMKLDDILRSMYEERAEDLADAALTRLPMRKRDGVWAHVRATAIANQYAGKPIRSELGHYFK